MHILNKAKNIVVEIRNSSKKLAKFRSLCKHLKKETGESISQLQLPVITRWFSTYNMVKSVIASKQILTKFASTIEGLALANQNRAGYTRNNTEINLLEQFKYNI